LSNYLSIFASSTDDDIVDAAATRSGPLENSVVADGFRASLARLRRSEVERGITLAGPHRDDVMLELNGMPARGYASHGESWSFALALKLASAEVLRRESSSGDPVVILDDVFAELDESRRGRLAGAVSDFEQVLITAAVFDDVPDELAGTVVRIRGGKVIQDGQR
jgi:DNA replication and repair protein RecF